MEFKYAVTFSKKGRARFIGHLDLLRLFQRALNRAALPVAYSLGFNPHQLITFAIPLPLGMESERERAEIHMSGRVSEADITRRINSAMPEGVIISGCRLLPEGEKGASVRAALYEMAFDDDMISRNLQTIIDETIGADEIVVTKKTKKKTSRVDIRPDIIALEKVSDNKIRALLSAGSERNLKPELLARYISEEAFAAEGAITQFDPLTIKYRRLEIYKQGENGEFIPM